MKKGISIAKRIVVFLLAVIVTISHLGNFVHASSNDRISAYISLAAGKQISDVDINSLNLSERDLQFLGVYVSNFYVPFGTELGTNSDVTTQNREDIKEALQTNLAFSDAMADSLTETLLGLTRSSVKELVLCVSKDYQGTLVEVPKDKMPLNYYTALTSMLGGLQVLAGFYGNSDTVIKNITTGTYKYGYFAYKSDNGYVPVFDFRIDRSELTPSAAVFYKCLESVDMELGYGFNYFDFTHSELGDDESSYAKLSDNLDMSQIYKMSIYGSTLSVDCFGNIIIMGGNHQYIAVPGCMNPYTWVNVDSKGEDVGKGLGGTSLNITNIPLMSMAVSDVNSNYLFTAISSPDMNGVVSASINTSTLIDKLGKMDYNDNGCHFELRKVRGSKSSKLSEGILGIEFGTNSYRDLAKDAELGFLEVYPNAKNIYNGNRNGIDEAWDTSLGVTDTIDIYTNASCSIKDLTQLNCDRAVDILDSYIYIDNLGEAHFDSTDSDLEFKTFNPDHFLSSQGLEKARESIKAWGSSSNNGFTNTYKDIKSGSMTTLDISKEAMLGIYFTYAFAGLYNEGNKEGSIGQLGYRLNSDNLPKIPDKALYLSEDAQTNFMDDSIRGWIYYLLHPSEGTEYFTTWISNKLSSFLLDWHDDMVGTNGTGSINGTTKYRGFSGYVTTPELTDIPWTNTLLNMYNNSIPFLLIIMLLLMLGSYVVGMLPFQKAVIGVVLFSICISLPSTIINGGVGVTNRFSSSLYGEKFTYWALIQHQSYSAAIDNAASSGNYSNYLKTLFEENAKATGNQGSESIMLKWQAPKKMASLMLTENDNNVFDSLTSSSLVSGLLNATYSGESYLEGDSSYLYRSYIDIANFSRYIHRGLSSTYSIQPISLSLTNDIKNGWDESLKDTVATMSTDYSKDRQNGYANEDTVPQNDVLRVKLPLSSAIVSDALEDRGKVADLGIGNYVGIDQRAFNFSIPMFNVKDITYDSVLEQNGYSCDNYRDEDYSGLAAYGLMSESVFYYFSWYLYETGLSDEASAYSGFRNMLLASDDAEFFYNTKGNGELKDFMDMKSLFTYTIPYLKQGNDLVKEWDELYGIYIYEDVPTEEGHENDPDIASDPEKKQKYWHNINVMRLYNVYTPWVDVMYDCSYADEEKISYLGETYVVADPLNPATYPADRPMVFSRSEMADYGLSEYNLTKVEKLIIECQDGMQERLFKLLNYHTFNDVVLNTAAAVNCAFEFNETFSENSIVGANHNIYPQSFELSDFSYDAFLRFILSNSTGDSMVVNKGESFYGNVVDNSSMTTVIVMLVLDIIAMYVIPGFKMFFIVGIFISSILIILITAFRVDEQQKFVTKLIKSFVLPTIKFTGISCGMALVVSWFMGEGNTSVTGSMETSIQVGDPVTVMLLMIVLNCFVIFGYFKVLCQVVEDIKNNGKLATSFIGGVVGSVGFAVTSGFKNISSKIKSTTGGGSSSGGSVSSSGDVVGSSSVRAKERAASRVGTEEYDDSESNSRINDYVGFNFKKKTSSSSKSSKDMDEKIKKGMSNLMEDGKDKKEGV